MIIPQIWQDALIKVTELNLAGYQFFSDMLAEWDELHKARMAIDADYAAEHERFEREWAAMMEDEESE